MPPTPTPTPTPHGWEPIPWDAEQALADEQRRGFLLRAAKPLVWSHVDPNNFPAEGIFDRDRDWFRRNDIDFIATFDKEDLILTRGVWFGFPDPPEWGLYSRPAGAKGHPWTPWGHFDTLPASWRVPGEA